MITLRKVPLNCCSHGQCFALLGGQHEPEVNSVGMYKEGHRLPGEPSSWRLECAGCSTVLRIFDTYEEATDAAEQHARNPMAFAPEHVVLERALEIFEAPAENAAYCNNAHEVVELANLRTHQANGYVKTRPGRLKRSVYV